MAKKQPVLLPLLLKYVILGVAIALLITWGGGNFEIVGVSSVFASTPTSIAQVSPEQLRSEAQSLNNQGHEQLALGKAQEALDTWERAMEVYAQIPDSNGVRGSQINQSIAWQALGNYRRACQTLVKVLNINNNHQICEPSTEGNQTIPKQSNSIISATALRTFGDVLRGIGKLDESQKALEQSLDIARIFDSPSDISMTLLSLGNTEQALYNQELDLYERTNSPIYRDKRAKPRAKRALECYLEAAQQAANLSTPNITQIQAKLNRLSLLLEENQYSDTEDLQPQIESLVADLLQNQSAIANLPRSQNTIYANINFAQSLNRLEKHDLAIQYTKDALEQAGILKDKRSESYAHGTLGHIYEDLKQLDKAQECTKRALWLAQSIQAWDISYEWQWQLGRIYKAQGKIKDAIAAYDVAVQDLDKVRQDLVSINPDAQFSFRDNVEPVYQEFLELLLRTGASPDNLEKASEVTTSLQLAELEAFLQCDLVDLVSIDEVNNPPAAIIYPIILEDRVEIIVKLPGSEKFNRYTTPISQENFAEAVKELKGQLRDKRNDVKYILPPAQKLYEWLIKPIAADLPASGTLVFVLDSTLQSIPMAVLHDGEQYLVEKYSIALSLGSQQKDPESLPVGQWNPLLAGVSEKAESYPEYLPPLPSVRDELNDIKAIIPSQILLNRQFTREAFQNQINASPFPVVHLATHGQFSSDPKKTLIYAWDEKIRVKQLDNILRSRGKTIRTPIELLVLSACETAQGDQRAALGLAGVALRARARSTVASLWQVSDGSTAKFMKDFYQELNTKNTTKAEALRQAQLTFLNDNYNQHPYYWAAFILSGNWL